MLYKVISNSEVSILPAEDLGVVKQKYKIFVFRVNKKSNELHMLTRKQENSWAFVKVSEAINDNKVLRYLNNKNTYDSAVDALNETVKYPQKYSIFACTTVKEVMTVFKEYGI